MTSLAKTDSITKKFGRAARRALMTVFAAAGLMIGQQAFGQQTRQIGPDDTVPVQIDTTRAPTATDTVATINKALREDAKQNFLSLITSARTKYSESLDLFENYLNTQLAKDPSLHNRAIVLDPVIMDVALALGIPPADAIREYLKSKSVTMPDKVVDWAVDALSEKKIRNIVSDITYTQKPSVNWDDAAPGVCLVVPSSDYAIASGFYINGFGVAGTTLFANLHEGVHVQDVRLNFAGMDLDSIQKTLDSGNAAIVSDPTAIKYLCLKYNGESLADIGALGYLIYSTSAGTEIIDQLKAWRMGRPDDNLHLSFPVLDELKRRIDLIGIDQFRSIEEDSLRTFYYSILDDKGITPARLTHVLKIGLAGDAKDAYVKEHIKDEDCVWALEMLKAQAAKDTVLVFGEHKMSSAERKAAREISDWNAKDSLLQTAFKSDGIITPATLIAAYGTLHRNLEAETANNPERAATCRQERIRLKSAFIDLMTTANFVKLNEAFKVTLSLEIGSDVMPPANNNTARPAPGYKFGQ